MPWCMGFSLQWFLLLWNTGFRHMGFSRGGAPALLSLGMWDLPRSRTKPVSPALAGRFMTREPPGKPGPYHLMSGIMYGVSWTSHCLCFIALMRSKLQNFPTLKRRLPESVNTRTQESWGHSTACLPQTARRIPATS